MANDQRSSGEQRERELAFSEVLREKVKASRPNLEDLMDRAEAKPESEEEKPERER